MRRFIAVLASALVLPLALAAVAGAHHHKPHHEQRVVPVMGTVVSTDAAAGSFVANVYDRGSGYVDPLAKTQRSTTQVTITTDSNTRVRVNGRSGSVADMSAGDRFVALFSGSPGGSVQSLVANPALAVMDHTPPKPHQLYAFVGTVTGVDVAGGTVTVDVTRSLPSGLVPAGSPPVSFTVGADTLVLGRSSAHGLLGGSLGDVSVGDLVAGGLVADAGESLAQVESTPLKVLLDLPALSGGSSSSGRSAGALHRAMSLLGGHASGPGGRGHASGRGGHASGRGGHARSHKSSKHNKHSAHHRSHGRRKPARRA